MSISRRHLLGGMATTAAAGSLSLSFRSRATSDSLTPAFLDCKRYKILEIYLDGACSHFDTFWVPDHIAASSAPDKFDELFSLAAAGTWHGILGTEPEAFEHTFGTGSHWFGPGCAPLFRERSDGSQLIDHARVIPVGHNIDPHSVARALVLTGLPFGRPRQSGLGAAISRLHGPSDIPRAWVLRSSYNYKGARIMSTSGLHGFENAPANLQCKVRSVPVNPPGSDLLEHYRQQYSALRSGVRSQGHDAYELAALRLNNMPEIVSLLNDSIPEDTPTGMFGGDSDSRMHIRTAINLLSHDDVHYVGVNERGVSRAYDLHYSVLEEDEVAPGDGPVGDSWCHSISVGGSIWNILDTLQREWDEGNLDLETTLVVINTEYGRHLKDTGSDHYPNAATQLLLGGPSLPGRTGSIAYSEDRPYGDARNTGCHPSVVKAAILAAAGVEPLQSDCFYLDELEGEHSVDTTSTETIVRDMFGDDTIRVAESCGLVDTGGDEVRSVRPASGGTRTTSERFVSREVRR